MKPSEPAERSRSRLLLWPRWVPVVETHSPFLRQRTLSHRTSSSRKDGHPWLLDSLMNAAHERPIGARKSGAPVTQS